MDRRDSGLIVPERLKVRDRNAPRANLGAGIKGWVDWALVGRDGRVVKGGQSPNMWLDQGLDELAVPSSGVSILGGVGTVGSGLALFGVTHAVVGTGSDTVDASDTALSSELARTSTVLGTPSYARTADGVYELSKTWVFDFGQANGNLTEWGIARAATLGLLTRALFVDESSNPITITKTSDYQLRIAYVSEIALTPVVAQPASLPITGVGTLNGDAMLIAGTQALGMGDLLFFVNWSAGTNQVLAAVSAEANPSYLGNTLLPSATHSNVNTPAAYVPGTYERTASHTWGVNNGNINDIRTIAARGMSSGSNVYSGFSFVIDSGDAFDKTNTNQLTLNDLFTVSWGRA